MPLYLSIFLLGLTLTSCMMSSSAVKVQELVKDERGSKNVRIINNALPFPFLPYSLLVKYIPLLNFSEFHQKNLQSLIQTFPMLSTFLTVWRALAGMKTSSPICGLCDLPSISISISPSARTTNSSVLWTKSAHTCPGGSLKTPKVYPRESQFCLSCWGGILLFKFSLKFF